MPDKNGANRGGARPGAGRKKKPLTERIEAGQKAVVMKIPDVETAQMPKIRDYFKAEQRQGELYAAEIYQETWQWLQERGCATLINPMLLEQYAMSAARWVQLEGINSEYGFILTTDGNVVDYDAIIQFMTELSEKYDIREVAYDRWNSSMIVYHLTDLGFTMVPFGQGFGSMSEPTKQLMRLVLSGELAHGGHPVLRWCMDNVVVRTDPAGNIKMDKARAVERIDGSVALVMALDRAMRCGGAGNTSVYEDRGLLFL